MKRGYYYYVVTRYALNPAKTDTCIQPPSQQTHARTHARTTHTNTCHTKI